MPSPSRVREARNLIKQAKQLLGEDEQCAGACEHLDATLGALDDSTDEVGRPKDSTEKVQVADRAKPKSDNTDAMAQAKQELLDRLKDA